MKILEWLQQRWRAPSSQYTYLWIPTEHVVTRDDAGVNDEPLVAGEHYFRLMLAEMSIEHDRQWGTQWQPSVYSAVKFLFGDQEEVVTHVAGPSLLEQFGTADAPKRVTLNYRLTPLVPFNGGQIEIEAGLLAVPGKNDIKAFLNTLTGFSKLLVVPELSKVLSLTSALADGLADLVGATQANPDLRFHDILSAAPGGGQLRSGYFAVVGIPNGQLASDRLWVVDSRLYQGASPLDARPFTGVSYMLFRIETSRTRDDWEALSAIREPYEEAIELVAQAHSEFEEERRDWLFKEADRRMGAAKLAALRSKELTRIVGRNQVIEGLRQGYEAAKESLARSGLVEEESDHTFSGAMKQPISVEDARALGEATESSLLLPSGSVMELRKSTSRPWSGWIRGVIRPHDVVGDVMLRWPASRTPPAPGKRVVRTPHMDILREQPLRLGDEFDVRVYTDTHAPRPAETSRTIDIVLPPEVKSLDLDVWIAGTSHFEYIGARTQPIQVDPHREHAEASAQFKLKLVKTQSSESPRVFAYFLHEGRPAGEVSRGVEIADMPVVATPADVETSAVLQLDRRAQLADLTLTIRDPRKDHICLECYLASAHPNVPGCGGPFAWNLGNRAEAIVENIMKQFVQPEADPEEILLSLRGAGLELWRIAPPEFQQAFWHLYDAKRLRSIAIVSEDAFIPWELMIPERPEGLEKHQPLGVTFLVGRWCPRVNLTAPQHIRLSSSLVINPKYANSPKPLKHATAEEKLVLGFVPGKTLDPVKFGSVMASFSEDGYELMHWICHGSQSGPGIQALYLDGEDKRITSLQLNDLRGLWAERSWPPLIFLNACEVGRPAVAMSGIGGFAKAFIDAGAAAVIAPLWSVRDSVAPKVAEEFYRSLQQNPQRPLAEILRDIRAHAYKNGGGEDSYAAYCFYGDPLARLTDFGVTP